MVKDIGDTVETVSVYNGEGDIINQWTLNYKIDVVQRVCIFHMLDFEFTAGPRKGEKITEAGAYAFRIHDDRWHEIHNLRLSANAPPKFNVFKRIVSSTSDVPATSLTHFEPMATLEWGEWYQRDRN